MDRRPGPVAVAVAAVCAVVAATHWPALSAGARFLDDHQYLVENPLVQQPSWGTAGRFFAEVLKPSTVRGYYQPLAMISLMLDYAAGGRPDHLRPFHRTSLALHVANSGLLAILLYLLFHNEWVAGLVALLFGVHPLTVEPVPWVAERKTLLASFFSLACLLVYVCWVRRGRRLLYVVCGGLYALALLSKPTSTSLPIILLLLDYWPLRRLDWRAVGEKVPLVIIGAVSAVVTVVSQGRAAGLEGGTGSDATRILLTVCHNVVFYLWTTVWPVNLTWHYPFPKVLDLSRPAVLAGVIGTALLMLALVISWRWTRAALVGWLLFFAAVLPTMGIIGFTYIIAAHKFVYLAALGLLLPLAALLTRLWHARPSRPGVRVVIVIATLLIAALEIRVTRRDLRSWQDTEGLHRRVLEVQPDAYAVRHNLATFLHEQGQIDAARQEFEQVLRDRPDHWAAHCGLGTVLADQGRPAEAALHFQEALRLRPDYFEARYSLGVVLAEQGRWTEAVDQYQEALRLRPADFRVHVNLGNAFAALGQFERALSCYDEALRLRPRYARGHFNRGLVLLKLARPDEAIAEFRAALDIDPNYAPARQQLQAVLEARSATQRGTP